MLISNALKWQQTPVTRETPYPLYHIQMKIKCTRVQQKSCAPQLVGYEVKISGSVLYKLPSSLVVWFSGFLMLISALKESYTVRWG